MTPTSELRKMAGGPTGQRELDPVVVVVASRARAVGPSGATANRMTTLVETAADEMTPEDAR